MSPRGPCPRRPISMDRGSGRRREFHSPAPIAAAPAPLRACGYSGMADRMATDPPDRLTGALGARPHGVVARAGRPSGQSWDTRCSSRFGDGADPILRPPVPASLRARQAPARAPSRGFACGSLRARGPRSALIDPPFPFPRRGTRGRCAGVPARGLGAAHLCADRGPLGPCPGTPSPPAPASGLRGAPPLRPLKESLYEVSPLWRADHYGINRLCRPNSGLHLI